MRKKYFILLSFILCGLIFAGNFVMPEKSGTVLVSYSPHFKTSSDIIFVKQREGYDDDEFDFNGSETW